MNMIKIDDIVKNFNSVHALKGISAQFKKGEITGLIGYNGSGKTTTFNIMVNYLERYSGTVSFNNHSPQRSDYHKISFLANTVGATDYSSIKSRMTYIARLYGYKEKEIIPKIKELAKEFLLEAPLKTSIRKLSKGNQQKIKLMQIFINPFLEYLFLDEPFDGLDPIMADHVSKKIIERKQDLVVIITSHRLEIIDKLCDSFYILREGKIVDYKLASDKLPVVVSVNPEINIDKLKGDFIKNITTENNKVIIVLNSIDDFVKLSKQLLLDKNYKYHSLEKTSLSESVFKKYSDYEQEKN